MLARANRVLDRCDMELCHWRPDELVKRSRFESAGMGELSYRDFQLIRALLLPGQLDVEEATFLGELVRATSPARPIIEIGTLFAFSTLVIAMQKARDQPLITVDNYSWNPLSLPPSLHRHVTQSVFGGASGQANIEFRDEDKEAFYREYTGGPPALFFCDADHSCEATLRDLTWAREAGAEVICGHDYNDECPGVKAAVDKLGGSAALTGSLYVLAQS